MQKVTTVGAACLAIALAAASPAMARGFGGGFHGGGAHFAGGFHGGGFHGGGFHHGGFGRGLAAGLIAGSVIGAGAYAYDPGYYDYDYGPGYYGGPTAAVGDAEVADDGYCAQRYRSYDPGSGTYLGYDGLRHPCP